MSRKKKQSVSRLFRKCEVDEEKNSHLPIPTQVISNEEHLPFPQTDRQKMVELELTTIADRTSKSLGISRRKFLAASGGMAAAFLAMNSVFGKFFDVEANELVETAASAEKFAAKEFIFDIHTHHVETGKRISMPPLLRYRDAGAAWGNKDLVNKEHKWEDLYLVNYIKEIFLDSDTSMAVITGLPAPTEDLNVLPPAAMVETRAEINGLVKSKRMLAHGLIRPPDGKKDLELMQYQKEVLKVDAWKGYPGQPFSVEDKGWFMDDEKTAYPVYETARKLGVKNICVHKGLALPDWDLERSAVKDVPKAALDFPDLNFLIYHAGFQGLREAEPAVRDDFKTITYVPWISDLCEARRKNPKMTNVYMDLGTTFGMMVITHPKLCAHALGMMIQSFGEDHVLWGTDSIWWGSPQWQIEAFRRFQIPEDLQKRFGYKPLTPEVKAKIFGLNAAKIHGVDVKKKLGTIPADYVTKLKAKYRAENYQPSNTQYGWIAG